MKYIKRGYCEDYSIGHYRVYTEYQCSNKAKYKVTFTNDRIRNVCGTHLRTLYKRDLFEDKPIKGTYIEIVKRVEEIKTGKVIYDQS